LVTFGDNYRGGKPLKRTVFFYAHGLSTHELTHLKQIGCIVADAIRE